MTTPNTPTGKQSSQTHSPLPWSYEPIDGRHHAQPILCPAYFNDGNKPRMPHPLIVHCLHRAGEVSIPEAKANAAYIVKACNHFEEMREALREIDKALNSWGAGHVDHARTIAREALAQLERSE